MKTKDMLYPSLQQHQCQYNQAPFFTSNNHTIPSLILSSFRFLPLTHFIHLFYYTTKAYKVQTFDLLHFILHMNL